MKKLLKDKPVEKKSDDILGYYSFAEQIVNVLKLLPEDDSFNFALCGEWGSGKTSILNLTKEIVEKENVYRIIQFNPWNITKKNNLIFEFLELLKNIIYEESSSNKIRTAIEKYSRILYGSFPTDGILLLILDEILKIFTLGLLKEKNTVSEQKNLLIDYLNNKYEGKPILVIIDDLDRLTNSEMCKVLQLIREIADFPHIVYLVAFDKAQLVNAIQLELKPKDSSEYLKKFFQLEWNIPKHSSSDIKNYIVSKMEQYDELKVWLSSEEKEYFSYLYENWISGMVSNIRDVILTFNSFYQKFCILKNYVNIIDLCSVTFIELQWPELYSYIRKNKRLLLSGSGVPGASVIERSIGNRTQSDYSKEREDFLVKTFLQSNVDNSKIQFAKKILSTLFPFFSEVFEIYTTRNEYQQSALKNRLLCSEVCFDAFFSQNICNIATIAPGEVKRILESNNSNSITSFLSSNLTNLKVLKNIAIEISQVLKQMNDTNTLYTIFCAFCMFGQDVQGPIEDGSLFPESIRGLVYELVCHLFNKLQKSEIYNFMHKFLVEDKHLVESYKFISFFFQMQGSNYKKKQEPEPESLYFTYDNFFSIINAVIDELNKNCADVELFDESLENIVFTFYMKYSPESLDKFYTSQLQKAESLIQLCIMAYSAVVQTNYESVNKMFEDVYNFCSLKGKGELIADYINEGKYTKLKEINQIKLAKVVDVLQIKSLQNEKTLNSEYWNEMKRLSENNNFR